jgi:hypothetical protein
MQHYLEWRTGSSKMRGAVAVVAAAALAVLAAGPGRGRSHAVRDGTGCGEEHHVLRRGQAGV